MPLPIASLNTDFAASSAAVSRSKPFSATKSNTAALSLFSPSGADPNTEFVLVPFMTNEHFFQAMKFPVGSEAFFMCADASGPFSAKRCGSSRQMPIRSDWDAGYRNAVMGAALLEKFGGTSHPDLAQLLDGTYDQKLVEDSPFDDYWGRGREGRGLNTLGRMLMKLRSDLRSGIHTPPVV